MARISADGAEDLVGCLGVVDSAEVEPQVERSEVFVRGR
jgi:hypothetical protein